MKHFSSSFIPLKMPAKLDRQFSTSESCLPFVFVFEISIGIILAKLYKKVSSSSLSRLFPGNAPET